MNDTFPPGQGEPLNTIISGNSDARVLVDSEENGGLLNFFLYVTQQCVYYFMLNASFRSFGFSGECLGQHSGALQAANLGDGHGSGQSSHVCYLVPFPIFCTANSERDVRNPLELWRCSAWSLQRNDTGR